MNLPELELHMVAKLKKHLLRCFATGIVAILPVAGLLFLVVHFENLIAGSWLKTKGYYFFGQGILLAVALLYLLGLVLSSVLGRWLFNLIDRSLDRLPLLGELYRTLKQLVGYDEGPSGMFKRVVWVAFDHPPRWELGLVTENKSSLAKGRTAVFVPNAPTPTTGRLIYVEESELLPTNLRVNEALQLLVSIGGVVPSQERFDA